MLLIFHGGILQNYVVTDEISTWTRNNLFSNIIDHIQNTCEKKINPN